MKNLLIGLLVSTLIFSSSAFSAGGETISVDSLQKQVVLKQAELKEVRKAIEDFEIREGKAMLELTDALKTAGTGVVIGNIVVPTVLMGLFYAGAQGGSAGVLGAVASAPSALYLFYRSSLGKVALVGGAAIAAGYVVYKGQEYIALDMDEMEALQTNASKLEGELNALEEILEGLPGDLELEAADLM